MQLLVLFVISFNLLLSDRIVTGTLWALVASSTALALLQAMGFTSEELVQDRISAVGENPNTLATILSFGLLALTGLAFGREKSNWVRRIPLIICPVILGFQIARTGSRGAGLALAVALLAFLFKKERSVASKLKVAVMICVLFCVLIGISLQ